MTPEAAEALRRENAYLKTRNAQLQSDLTDLAAELARATQALDQVSARRAARAPDPLAGGQ